MHPSTRRLRATFVLPLVTALALTATTVMAVDVKTGFDKKFDFTRVRTWGWNPAGAGDVRMARGPNDDPDATKKAAEPVIVSAVTAEMERQKLQFRADAPDVYVTYYLLLTTGSTAQQMGQFLPATVTWGLPIFGAQTTALEVMDYGSLVLDVSANKEVVWRGVARSQIKTLEKRERREALLREAVRDLLKKFPPKP